MSDQESNIELDQEIIDAETVEATTETESEEQEVVTEEIEDVQEVEEELEEDKKSFFKKKDKKDKKDLQIEELTDKYKRTMAEFENFRKRTEKEKAMMYEIGAKEMVIKFLPVVDNFERGLATISEEDMKTPIAEGMDKIYKQLLKMLEDSGVKEIPAEGAEFDPNFHNAVMHIEDEELGENVIAEVLQKGYSYKEMVVRHSMVKVAN